MGSLGRNRRRDHTEHDLALKDCMGETRLRCEKLAEFIWVLDHRPLEVQHGAMDVSQRHGSHGWVG